jgi:DNA repair protein NreA
MKPSSKCLYCKTRYPEKYCRLPSCPLYTKLESMKRIEKGLKGKEFDSSSKTPFVSRFGYPNINVGVLAPPGVADSTGYDAPKEWAARGAQIPEILEYRSSMVNSRFRTQVKARSKQLETAQEIAMARRAVAMDVTLKERPRMRLQLRPDVAPMGPSAELLKLELTENPRVEKAVDKAVSDDELKAVDAMGEMTKKGIDEGVLRNLLSVGLLGIKKDRKLVPTRWSITATDDTVSKQHIAKLRDFRHAECTAFFGGYLGNFYLVLFIPGIFSYELFEMMPHEHQAVFQFVTDFELHEGRKAYAQNTAGGYYATRLAVAEKLVSMKRQARVLALRFITEAYSLPLGVWVVREASRKAMGARPIEFASLNLMLDYACVIGKKKFGCSLEPILAQSKLLDFAKKQSTLDSFR